MSQTFKLGFPLPGWKALGRQIMEIPNICICDIHSLVPIRTYIVGSGVTELRSDNH